MRMITENQRATITGAGFTPEFTTGGPSVTCSLSRGTDDIWSDYLLSGNWESLAYWVSNYQVCGCERHATRY